MTLDLSPGGPADVPDVMTVMEQSFDPRYGEAWTAAQLAGILPMPGVWLVVAREAGRPVGFALSRVVADEAELLLLAVRHGCERRGMGRRLLDRFAEDARTRGATRLHLEVREGNHAVNLYHNAGYKLIGRRRGYYKGPEGVSYDALTLGRSAG